MDLVFNIILVVAAFGLCTAYGLAWWAYTHTEAEVQEMFCRLGRHQWGEPVHVSVPTWDRSAKGLLWRCERVGCKGVKAR